MPRLAIRKVVYIGDKYSFASSNLADGLVIVEGANGTGKTTFADLIYYGLGGEVSQFRRDEGEKQHEKHKEIVSDSHNSVTLTLNIDSIEYVVSRSIGSNDVLISEAGSAQTLPIVRSKDNKRIYSDWLLEKLGIEPVTVYHAGHAGKINITDLFRLVYHDQNLNPRKIYKLPDRTSFVSDSSDFRHAIFEILVGKHSQDYYSSFAKLKAAELALEGQETRLNQFTETLDQILPNREDLNVSFIDKQLKENVERLTRLEQYKNSLLNKPQSPVHSLDVLTEKKQRLIDLENDLMKISEPRRRLLGERAKLQRLREQLLLEITQIQKIVFAHQHLKLFEPNTCPCCLQPVSRAEGKCLCGNPIDESQFERFFYSTEEYIDILKSKKKNVETVDSAFQGLDRQYSELETKDKELSNAVAKQRESVAQSLRELDDGGTKAEFGQVESEVVSLKVSLTQLAQQRKLEIERQRLQDAYVSAKQKHKDARLEERSLFTQAQRSIQASVKTFNEEYNRLMCQTVQNCRSAIIDDDYDAVVNDGEYREASANVPKRLLYFATLLWLSLTDSDVRFPRFLLVDTPDTAGIDRDNLMLALEAFVKVFESIPDSASKCQVILTTGINEYPERFKNNVILTLTKQRRLLESRPSDDTAQKALLVSFHAAMVEVYRRAKEEAGYDATRFLGMIEEKGGYDAAKSLLYSDKVSDGYTALWERKRLDLSVEAVILRPEWNSLFSDSERAIARKRLKEFGYETL